MIIKTDTFVTRHQFRHCIDINLTNYTLFQCKHEPYYLLVRDCSTEGYEMHQFQELSSRSYTAGLCCKVNHMFKFVYEVQAATSNASVNVTEHNKNIKSDRNSNNNNTSTIISSTSNTKHYQQLFKTLSNIQYYLQIDDDVYIVAKQLLTFLARVEQSNINHLAWIANNQYNNDDSRGILYFKSGCKEMKLFGAYQPVLLNKQAMLRVATGMQQSALVDICKTFRVPQSVALGIVAWLYELQHMFLPGVEMNFDSEGECLLVCVLYSVFMMMMMMMV